jgi:hypothetical protein
MDTILPSKAKVNAEDNFVGKGPKVVEVSEEEFREIEKNEEGKIKVITPKDINIRELYDIYSKDMIIAECCDGKRMKVKVEDISIPNDEKVSGKKDYHATLKVEMVKDISDHLKDLPEECEDEMIDREL